MSQSPNADASRAALDLTRYGWDQEFEAAFAEHRRAGLTPARIVRVDGGLCDAVTEHGPRILTQCAGTPQTE